MWVVLIAGSTGTALGAVRLPNRYVTPSWVHAARAAGSWERSFLAIIAQAILASLLASAMAATLVGLRANNPVSQGRCRALWSLAWRITASAPAVKRLRK
jgi:hypothetical protein